MYKNVLESIQGITIYPLISLAIFFTFFVLLIVWVARMKKTDIEEYSKLPLEEDAPTVNYDVKS
jgi:cytochrome c oxidase cbb3-type subunit IV